MASTEAGGDLVGFGGRIGGEGLATSANVGDFSVVGGVRVGAGFADLLAEQEARAVMMSKR